MILLTKKKCLCGNLGGKMIIHMYGCHILALGPCVHCTLNGSPEYWSCYFCIKVFDLECVKSSMWQGRLGVWPASSKTTEMIFLHTRNTMTKLLLFTVPDHYVSFIHSFVCSFIHLFVCLFGHSFIHLFIHSFIHLFILCYFHIKIYIQGIKKHQKMNKVQTTEYWSATSSNFLFGFQHFYDHISVEHDEKSSKFDMNWFMVTQDMDTWIPNKPHWTECKLAWFITVWN